MSHLQHPTPQELWERLNPLQELLEAAKLKRNVLIYDGFTPGFEGDWVAVPQEDFDALRAAVTKVEQTK